MFVGYTQTDDKLRAIEIRQPHDGWEKSWENLRSHYILSLPDAESLKCNVIALDGDRHQIEILHGGTYRTYGYSNPDMADDNHCKEAKEILAIGKVLQAEYQPVE